MSPRISILIPCFDSEATLTEAFESCYRQGLPQSEFEVIMIDDSSSDSTRELMGKLASQYSNVKTFHHETNRGGGATRNTAASYASAPVLFCLDSDDILPDHTLDKMLSFMEEEHCDGVGIHKSIKFKGRNTKDVEVVHTFGYTEEEIPLESLLQRGDVYCPLYSTFMITKEAFLAVGGYPEHHGFDTQGMAWRFLAAGYKALTCPDTTYLHRTHFKKSYYLREADAGRVNYNWQDIFLEHLSLFDEDTQAFILNFNCKDFSKNIFDEVKKREKVFKRNVSELLGTPAIARQSTTIPRIYIPRNSARGITIRIRGKLKKIKPLRFFVRFFYLLYLRIVATLREQDEKQAYYQQIAVFKKQKKIVVDLRVGGIGDCLVFSTLPRLLKERYDIDFYLSERSLEVIRQKDTYKLIFESNPYFKGVSAGDEVFRFKPFESEKDLCTLITDKGGESLIETLERQFGVSDKGQPEMYYTPNTLNEYKNVILVDKNTISGERFGWIFKKNIFEKTADRLCGPGDKIEFVDPKAQDMKTYIDMIISCKHFVCTFSGGASIAAAYDIPRTVIFPVNARDRSNYQFAYKSPDVTYI